MPPFARVLALDCLAPGAASATAIEGSTVALFNVGGSIYAIDDFCMRCGGSLAAGTLSGTLVACSGCDWEYDVVTGSVTGIPALRIDTFEVRVAGPDVLVPTPLEPLAR
jgi:nitrite reductase/ring-hydroxylating ferredoxin subunit